MKEFKNYATMLDEYNAKEKEKWERTKQLRKEADFEMRMQEQKWIEENEWIVRDIREHYTNEQIANREYLLLSTPSRLNEQANVLMETSRKLEILRGRIYNIEVGNPSMDEPLKSFDV